MIFGSDGVFYVQFHGFRDFDRKMIQLICVCTDGRRLFKDSIISKNSGLLSRHLIL